MKKLCLLTAMFMVFANFTACSQKEETAKPASSPETTISSEKSEEFTLTIFAASSLTEALEEIAELYKKENPNITLSFNFDSSGKLQTQIENGAEADLFISAAQKQMNTLEEAKLIDISTREDLLENKVVLVVPESSTKGITSFEDCLTDKVSLMSIGNADVPVGQYTEEIFTYLGGWDTIQSKSSMGSSVKEVLSQVESGSVDCGIVYSTDAVTSTGVKSIATAPENSHKPVSYPIAVLENAEHSQGAIDFIEFLNSETASEVFTEIGFGIVD
ncbi:MAG: molybdate ABC transporter substrate-binding protein [Oscillospiraceae bacterium]|jgi:molybdate transport system substrate-binding protein|nr:molybdate ABC transporter substrate-binding protein [Oscillospiraceae bacterium]